MKRVALQSGRVAIAALGVDLSADVAPTAFRILPAGEFRAWDGRPSDCPAWRCEEADGKRVAAELAARTRQSVIDYEHATLKAKKDAVKAPAAGWFKTAEWRADGLWLTGVEWTAMAAREIADKAYRYISPVFTYDEKTGRVGSLLHAALTNEPGLDALTDLAALAAYILLPSPTHRAVREPPLPSEDSMECQKKLRAALDLAETATETEALSAVAALKTNVAALSAQALAPDPAKYAPVAALTAVQAEKAELSGKLAALQAQIDGGKVEALIEKGKADGKLPPAIEDWARDLGRKDIAALTAYLEKCPAGVKPGQTQTGGKPPDGQGVAALSAEDKEVIKALGISREQFAKGKV
jgi:phage I-like protein